MIQGIIFDIKRFSINDGPGIRTTVFFKGCSLRCAWCHNPESQSHLPQKAGDKKLIGDEKRVDEVMFEIEKEIVFYDQSGGGVTFSGGEPLEQPRFLGALLDACRTRDIHTAIDTSGNISPDVFNPFIDRTDLFLYDLKIMDEHLHIACTGVSNTHILKNLQTLSQKNKPTIIRFPVIPGFTDGDDNIQAIGDYVSSLQNIRNIHEINLIPYHRTGEAKYKRLNMTYNMVHVLPPSEERKNDIENLFRTFTKNIDIKWI
ncbi:MAG: glycyl-radical enzyme activating protein [Candidatus Omnitrophota bacterium]